MVDLVRFPPTQPCHRCGGKLRRATEAEIQQGLADPDPVTRQLFAHAVQGDMNRKFVVSNRFTASLEHETDPGSWVMMCNNCGARMAQLPPVVE